MTGDWRSVHVFCHEPAKQDELIQHVAEAMDAAGEPWFFVRYWLHGPHVRFRVRDEAALEGIIAVARSVLGHPEASTLRPEDFYAGIPVALREGNEVTAETPWNPPGTIRREPYEPEIGRYGGADAMPAAEDAFVASTRLAVGVLRDSRSRPARLVAAVYAMHAVVDRLGLGDEFSRYGAYWASLSAGAVPPAAVEAVLQPVRRGVVLTDVERLVEPWIRSLERTRSLLGEGMAMVTASQIHMTNNRLGVPVEWEAAAGLALWPGAR